MPTKCGQKDSKGYFCRWGSQGKKYYYKKGDKASMEQARKKADAQGAAAHASGYQGSYDKEKLTEELKSIKVDLESLKKKIKK